MRFPDIVNERYSGCLWEREEGILQHTLSTKSKECQSRLRNTIQCLSFERLKYGLAAYESFVFGVGYEDCGSSVTVNLASIEKGHT